MRIDWTDFRLIYGRGRDLYIIIISLSSSAIICLLEKNRDSRPSLYALVQSSVVVSINFNKLISGVVLSQTILDTFVRAFKVSDGTQVPTNTKAFGILTGAPGRIMLDDPQSSLFRVGGDYYVKKIPVGSTSYHMCNMRFVATLCAAFCTIVDPTGIFVA